MARDRSEGGAIPGRGLGSLLDAAEAGARGRRCETVIASSGEAIWSGALDGTIESWNPAAERLYGYRAEEIVGRSAAILRPV